MLTGEQPAECFKSIWQMQVISSALNCLSLIVHTDAQAEGERGRTKGCPRHSLAGDGRPSLGRDTGLGPADTRLPEFLLGPLLPPLRHSLTFSPQLCSEPLMVPESASLGQLTNLPLKPAPPTTATLYDTTLSGTTIRQPTSFLPTVCADGHLSARHEPPLTLLKPTGCTRSCQPNSRRGEPQA